MQGMTIGISRLPISHSAAISRAWALPCGGMFGIFFTDETVTTYAQAIACDVEQFKAFFHGMLAEGVYLAPSAFEAGFLSSAHTEEDIETTLAAARWVFVRI